MKTQKNVNFAGIVARFTMLLNVVSTLMNFKLKEDFKNEVMALVGEIKDGKSVKAGYITYLSRGLTNLLNTYFSNRAQQMEEAVQSLVDSEIGLDLDLVELIEKHRKGFVETLQLHGDDLEKCAAAHNTFYLSLDYVEQEQKSRVAQRHEKVRAQHNLERERAAEKKQAKFDRKIARKASAGKPEIVIPATELAAIATISL